VEHTVHRYPQAIKPDIELYYGSKVYRTNCREEPNSGRSRPLGGALIGQVSRAYERHTGTRQMDAKRSWQGRANNDYTFSEASGLRSTEDAHGTRLLGT
jgi:hypothetical protein